MFAAAMTSMLALFVRLARFDQKPTKRGSASYRLSFDDLEGRQLMAAGMLHGLEGLYYKNQTLSGKPVASEATKDGVKYVWVDNMQRDQTAAPGGLGHHGFSVVWEGCIKPAVTGDYTFYTSTDDGVRLMVDNRLLINKFKEQPLTEWESGDGVNPPLDRTPIVLHLEKGVGYSVVMDYFANNVGPEEAYLKWSATGAGGRDVVAKDYVPQAVLFHSKPEKVKSQSATFADLEKEYANLVEAGTITPEHKHRLEQKFERDFKGFDFNDEEDLKKSFAERVGKLKGKALIRASFEGLAQLSVGECSGGSIIQVVSITKETVNAAGNLSIEDQGTHIEGFAVGSNGKAFSVDEHKLIRDQLNTDTTKSVKYIVTIESGLGLVKGEVVQGTDSPDSVKGYYSLYKGAAVGDITWLGPTEEKKVVIEYDREGTWAFEDQFTGVKKQGKFNNIKD